MIAAIKRRRSIRNYLDQAVTDDQLNDILESAMYAPSANAKYPWELVVVKDGEIKEKLSKTTPWSLHLKNASVVIAVIGHEKDSADWVEDCSIVAEHIWLSAVGLGLGSCWTQIRGNDNAEKEVKALLNVPDEHRVLCLMPLGVPAKEVSEHTAKDFDRGRVKQEKYK